MTSIGDRLRRQRKERGLELEQVAREIKINTKLLEAIEADDFTKLPGGVFRKSFIRQYARALGVEESEISVELNQLAFPQDYVPPIAHQEDLEKSIPALPTTDSEMKRRWLVTSFSSFAGVLAVMLACAGIYSWWQHREESERSLTKVVAEVKPEPTPAKSEPPPSAPAPTTTAVPSSPASGSAAPAQSAPGNVTPSPTEAPSANSASAVPQSVPSAPSPEGKFRVDLSVSEPTWILALVDGKPVYVGTLESNQAKVFEGTEKVRIRVGNAGAVSLSLNGKPVGALGPRGQIRIVELTPTGAEITAPPKPETPATAPQPTGTQPPPPEPAKTPPDSTTQRMQGADN